MSEKWTERGYMHKPRGRMPTGQRKYEVQRLHQRHHEIARLALMGFGNKDIAIKLGVTPQTVSNCLNSRVIKDKLGVMRTERDLSTVSVAAVIKDLDHAAAQELGRFVLPELNAGIKDELRLKAAMDILDRNGHAPPTVVHNQHLHAHMTAEDIEEIKQRSREAARNAGILEVEVNVASAG